MFNIASRVDIQDFCKILFIFRSNFVKRDNISTLYLGKINNIIG